VRGALGALAVVAALAAFAATPSAAFAGVIIGNPCGADGTEADATIIGLSNQTSEPFLSPVVPPERKFVITRWSVDVGTGIGPIAQQLIASHQAGEQDDVKVGESAVETLVPGHNEFATRIPVSEYDHIGLRGPEETLVCHHAMNTAGLVAGQWAVGEKRHFEVLVNLGAPVTATVEPDEDGDGYGDETQDGCPISAFDQGPCVFFHLITPHRKETRRALWLELSATLPGTASVGGTISWPRTKPKRGRRVVELTPVNVSLIPGTILTVKLALPRSVRRYLAKLPSSRTVQAELDVAATSERGDPASATRHFTVKGRRHRRPG